MLQLAAKSGPFRIVAFLVAMAGAVLLIPPLLRRTNGGEVRFPADEVRVPEFAIDAPAASRASGGPRYRVTAYALRVLAGRRDARPCLLDRPPHSCGEIARMLRRKLLRAEDTIYHWVGSWP